MKYANLRFTKISATGNDFIVIDNRRGQFDRDDRDFFARISQRRTGVGSDGVLLIEKEPDFDFRLRYFNPDGSESGCGNGARAAAYFAALNQIVKTEARFVFGQDTYEALVRDNLVKLKFPSARGLRESVGICSEPDLEEAGFVDTGVPHYLVFTRDVQQVDVAGIGKSYRWHDEFKPEGTNVNFVEVLSDNAIKIRTFERGVEDETLACGTGAVAAALFAHLRKGLAFPITVQARGGELTVHWDAGGNFYLEGEVEAIYQGTLL